MDRIDETLPKIDRTALSIVPLDQSDCDLEYWLSKTPEERLAAVELNRRMIYGYDRATSRLQRFFEIVTLERR